MVMVLTRHIYAQRLGAKERSESPPASDVLCTEPDTRDDQSDFTQPAPRMMELLELLEVAQACGDEDACTIIEAELFTCFDVVEGGRDV